LPRNARPRTVTFSLLRTAAAGTGDAGLADGTRRAGTELRGLRVAGLPRRARSDTARAVRGGLLSGHESLACLSTNHSAAGAPHRFAADDERLRITLQRHFGRLRNLRLGTRDRVPRTRECVGRVPSARSHRLGLLPSDESAARATRASSRNQDAARARCARRSVGGVGMIRVEGLGKNAGAARILRGVNFSVEPRTVLGVMGASGSGKTTLLRCMNGLERVTEGAVECDDVRLEAGLAEKEYQRRVKQLRRR